MIWIGTRNCEFIKEHRRSLIEADVVFFDIAFSFGWVPFKFHGHKLSSFFSQRTLTRTGIQWPHSFNEKWCVA
jgi:hypothetical protein